MKTISGLTLRPTEIADLETLFSFQADEEAGRQAAFMPKDPKDKKAYLEKMTRLLQDPTINNRTILLGDRIVGSVAKFMMEGEAEITYWVDKAYWRQGIATQALRQFLDIEPARPIFARVAFDNIGSQKLLEHSGFQKIGEDRGFASARGMEITEFIYRY